MTYHDNLGGAHAGARAALEASGCRKDTAAPPVPQHSPRSLPHDWWPESTIPLLLDGYRFISRRCERLGSDIFEGRLLLRKTIFLRGAEASRLFYDSELFQREGAAPSLMMKTLTGEGGVQGLDGQAHADRKALFLDILNPSSLDELVEQSRKCWSEAAAGWPLRPEITLLTEAEKILCTAVCRWAGVPLNPFEVARRAAQMTALIEAPAGLLWAYYRGRLARLKLEKWCARVVEARREGRLHTPSGFALDQISRFRDSGGNLLPARIAAVELLNLLRPTVAVARYVAFAARALHLYPEEAAKVRSGDRSALLRFVQEVRRTTPFFPFVAALTRREFIWNGYVFPQARRVILDLYGTNRHPALWDSPGKFDPERFRGRPPSLHGFIPHGGGDHLENHRCAGEAVAVRLLAEAVRFLVHEVRYTVPPQNLEVDLRGIPARPRSGMVLTRVLPTV